MEEYKENLSIGESYELILLEPYNGGKVGDIVTVYRGVYNSLIDMGKAIPLNCWEDVPDNQRLAINAKNLEKEVEELLQDIVEEQQKRMKLEDKIEVLEQKIKEYENRNTTKTISKKKKKKKATKKKTTRKSSKQNDE